MANVVITKELGYIKIDLGSYFPGTTLEKTHYFPPRGWQGVCTIRVGAVDGIEFHVSHEPDSFKLDIAGGAGFMAVDSVNGVIPTDITNLLELILALIQ
jgi:hypothetical protein